MALCRPPERAGPSTAALREEADREGEREAADAGDFLDRSLLKSALFTGPHLSMQSPLPCFAFSP